MTDQGMPDQEPPKRTAQMYDRPAGADGLPMGRLVLILVGVLVAGLLAAKFIFHVHFGHLLHAGH